MLGKEAKRRNRIIELRQFLSRFCPTLDKPRQRFFRQAVFGILSSGSLVVSRWVRWIGGCKEPFYVQKRLLNNLKSADWDDQKAWRAYQSTWGQKVQQDTALIIDLCDLAKPRARRMKYLALVRDGSEDKLVYGYWCLEIYAYFGQGAITPLLLDPYSMEDPATVSENARILRGVQQVMAATGGRGVLLMDAGADRDNLMIPWLDDNRRFVVRCKGDRHLLLADGTRIEAALLTERLLHQSGGQAIAWQEVFLPERSDHPMWMVCRVIQGHDRPLMLLGTLRAENLATARTVLAYYRQRWKCEEKARFGKTGLGMERFCLRTYEAFGRLMLLLSLAMSFLCWLALRQPALKQWLISKHPGQRQIKFPYYRLLEWLNRQIRSPVARILTT
jgi:hypothetical protein